MEQQKNVTFDTDLSKNHEFVGRLKAILNREDSSIALCYITQSVDQRYTVFIEPFDCENNGHLSFSFHPYDLPFRTQSTKNFSDSDVAALTELFSEFALTNRYEGLFFASKFFTPEYRAKPHSVLVLKYTFDENKNRLIIDGKKVSKHYAVVAMSSLSKYLDLTKLNETLIPCNVNILQNEYKAFDEAVKQLQKYSMSQSSDCVVVEFYKDFETFEAFVSNIFQFVDGNVKSFAPQQITQKT